MEEAMFLFAILLFGIGLFFGSFFNVVAIRILKNESIAYPPSHCVHCNHRLGILDLIPLLSYLGLRGKCRYCFERISPIYPFGESLTALLYGLLAYHFQIQTELIVALVFVSILVITVITDLREMLIPNKIIIIGIIILAALRMFIHPLPLYNYALAFIIGGSAIFAISIIGSLILRKESMGGGDLKLFALIGLVLGMKLILLSIFLASLFGSLYGLYLIILGRYDRGKYIPFAPFIVAGSIVAYIWGESILDWYLGIFL